MATFTNRIIYQSQAVAMRIGSSPAAVVAQNLYPWVVLNGVQSVNYGAEVAREDVFQFGKLTAADRVILETPVATAEVSMHYPNGSILAVDFSHLLEASIAGWASSELVIALDKESEDFASTADVSTVTLQSANMSSFNFEASVGAMPTLTLGFEGTSLSYSTVAAPALGGPFGIAGTVVDPTASFSTNLIPFTGVIVQILDEYSGFFTNSQSATLSFDLGFEGLQKLGSAQGLQYARLATLPASASLDVEGLAINHGMSITLSDMFQRAGSATVASHMRQGARKNVSLILTNASTASVNGIAQPGTVHTTMQLQNATLDSSNYSASLGDNATCSATFGVSISALNPSASESALKFF